MAQPRCQLSADSNQHRPRLLYEVGEVVGVPERSLFLNICEGWDAAVRFCRVAEINGRSWLARQLVPPSSY
jgi:hypothetical protein